MPTALNAIIQIMVLFTDATKSRTVYGPPYYLGSPIPVNNSPFVEGQFRRMTNAVRTQFERRAVVYGFAPYQLIGPFDTLHSDDWTLTEHLDYMKAWPAGQWLRDLRVEHRADLVHIFKWKADRKVENGKTFVTCGAADAGMTWNSVSAFESHCRSLNPMQHEIGHNLQADHDVEAAGQPGAEDICGVASAVVDRPTGDLKWIDAMSYRTTACSKDGIPWNRCVVSNFFSSWDFQLAVGGQGGPVWLDFGSDFKDNIGWMMIKHHDIDDYCTEHPFPKACINW